MLDIKRLRENPEFIQQEVIAKKVDADITAILKLDDKRKEILGQVERLKAERNSASKKIGILKKSGEDASEAIGKVSAIKGEIETLDQSLKENAIALENALLYLPNIPHETVPNGSSEEDNLEIRKFGEPTQHNFTAVDHKTLGENLGLFDFERGAKISGSGFPVYTGLGAKLERALIQFFIDCLEEDGFEEVIPPHLVNAKALLATGQLPKFADQLYSCPEDKLYLIPTAEVPITNIHADEVLTEAQLPIKYCGYTPCFRREAGSWGRDVRGFLRLHQFNKVEMVQFAHPETSYQTLENMVGYAENILKKLGLHYRVISLCKGDLGFGAAKCYDIEVWSPVEEKWLECSSVSNFEDFQARRGKIRAKIQGKNTFVHTLNGSGLATPRVLVALLDNFQNEDGSWSIPEVLQPYLKNKTTISK